MSETTAKTEALAGLLAKPEQLEILGVPHVLLPPGHTIHDFEKLLPEPRRIRAGITAHEIAGFISYINRFKNDRAALYSGPRATPKLEGRLDDNQPGSPSHGTHKIAFNCPHTVEWLAWNGANKRPQGQVEFAEFIENNLKDIVEPNGADVLTATLAFQDTGRAEFKSAVRLNDGRVQFQFIEKDDTGELKFPERLKIAVPVFEGQVDRYPVGAKLRYRIDKEGALTIWYDLERPDVVLRQAYNDLIAHVEKETGLSVHRAS